MDDHGELLSTIGPIAFADACDTAQGHLYAVVFGYVIKPSGVMGSMTLGEALEIYAEHMSECLEDYIKGRRGSHRVQ